MNSKIISRIKSELKAVIHDKDVIDIILFGSVAKGKALAGDIDIAIISDVDKEISKEGYHISKISPKDFFINPPSIIHTIIREGYSIKNNKHFSEYFRFKSNVLFVYELRNFNASKKVQIINSLRGNKKNKGLVEESKGEWLANQVFLIPIESSYIIEKFMISHEIKFKRMDLLID